MRPVLSAFLLVVACQATAADATREHIVPQGDERAYNEYHYSPAVKVGDLVFLAGIPAGPGNTYEERIHAMFKRLATTLEAAGATLDDVVEVSTFHAQAKDTASFDAEFAKFAPIQHEYFPDHYPAWTAVGTSALLAEGAPVEMRVIAVIGSGKHPKVSISEPAK